MNEQVTQAAVLASEIGEAIGFSFADTEPDDEHLNDDGAWEHHFETVPSWGFVAAGPDGPIETTYPEWDEIEVEPYRWCVFHDGALAAVFSPKGGTVGGFVALEEVDDVADLEPAMCEAFERERDALDAPGQGRPGNVDDPVPDAEYRDEPPEHAPPCDDCGEREAVCSVQCPIDEDRRLDLCTDCYEERGPGIEICHLQRDSDWDVNGGRALAKIEGAEKRHMNNTAFPAPGWIGNPYPMEEESDVERWRVLKAFREDFLEKVRDGEFFAYHLGTLRGKRVACWCRAEGEEWPDGDGDPCHLDVVHAALMGVYRQE